MKTSADAWKQAVLVPQADSLGAVAVIRSLGLHKYQVHAASVKTEALGCQSNYATLSHICPSYQSNDYLPWLRATISQHKIEAIIPSEGFLLAIKNHFYEFAPLMPIPQDHNLVFGCLSKVFVLDFFLQSSDTRLQQHLPKTVIITPTTHIESLETEDWMTPFFVKGDGYYNKNNDSAFVTQANNWALAEKNVTAALKNYEKVLLQDCRKGIKATVNLLMQDGYILAESMLIARHENPHTGGLTSLRESWWNQHIYEDAVLRMHALGWNGPAMLEYKWDEKTQTFNFIEINARYWAALHLDILAGLHFPAIQLEYFFHKTKPEIPLRLNKVIKVRHALPADFGYLLSKIKDKEIGNLAKLRSMLGFFLYFFHPNIYSDLNYPGDRKLAWLNTKAFIMELTRSCINKLR